MTIAQCIAALVQTMLPRPTSPEEFSALIRAEIQKWGEVIKDAGIKVE